MAYAVRTQIEIAATPSAVRSVFLNTSNYSEWSTSFIKSIEPVNNNPLSAAQPGDKLKVVLPGMSFSPKVLENTATTFKWRGALFNLVVGDHRFVFEPSTTTPGGTTFTQAEDFSGWLIDWFLPKSGSAKTSEGFEGFNRDLKKRVEGLKQSGQL